MIKMIAELPSGLDLYADRIEDQALQQSYPINATAALFFSLVDGKRSLALISQIMAETYQHDPQQVIADVMALSRNLQQHFLLNLREDWRQTLLRWLICVVHLIQPSFYSWRYAIPPTGSYTKMLIYIYPIVLRALLSLLGPILLLMLMFGIMLGHPLTFIGIYIALSAFVVLSATLHEAAHLFALRRYAGANCGFIAVNGPSFRIIRPRTSDLKQELVISLIGPLTPTLLALALLLFHLLVPFWVNWLFIMLFGIHALQLVVPNPDLHNIFRVIRQRYVRIQDGDEPGMGVDA